MSFFESRPNKDVDDICFLVGDFNATGEYIDRGAMQGYFKASIENTPGVQADAAAADDGGELESRFKAYMTAPFTSINKRGWTFAYDDKVGITSGFGHLIDHMAMSRPLQVISAEVLYTTNQKFGGKPKDTDLPLTDHNMVKTVFSIEAPHRALIAPAHGSPRERAPSTDRQRLRFAWQYLIEWSSLRAALPF